MSTLRVDLISMCSKIVDLPIYIDTNIVTLFLLHFSAMPARSYVAAVIGHRWRPLIRASPAAGAEFF